MNQLDMQAGYGQGLPFPLGIVLPRIQQFHVRQTLRHTTPEQVSQVDLLLLVPNVSLNAGSSDCLLKGRHTVQLPK